MRFEPKQLVDVEVAPSDAPDEQEWLLCTPPGGGGPARIMPRGPDDSVRTEIVDDDGGVCILVRWGMRERDAYPVHVLRRHVRPVPAFNPPAEETEVSITATVVSDTGGPTLTVRVGDAIVVVPRDRVYA